MPGRVWAAIAVLALGALLGYVLWSAGSRIASPGTSKTAPSVTGATPAPGQAAFEAGMQRLLDRLSRTPHDAALLAEIGNRYYDHQEWGHAVQYYRRALQVEPDNVDVRTDMGTAIWYGGDPWNAMKQYKTALRVRPDYAQTLFNMGVVQWRGMHDDRAALKTWQILLKRHPDYADRKKVERYIEQVRAEVSRQGAAEGSR